MTDEELQQARRIAEAATHLIVDTFINDRLAAMSARPRMWATSKASFGFMVVQLVELAMLRLREAEVRAHLIALQKRIFGNGPLLRDAQLDDSTEDWCVQVVDIAKATLQELGLRSREGQQSSATNDDELKQLKRKLSTALDEIEQLRAAIDKAARGAAVTQANTTTALREAQEQLAEADREVERLRTTRDHSCACSVNDGSAPLVKHDKDCPIRVNLRRRISPELALQRLGAALDSSDEAEELRAERDALRTDLCNLLARAHRDGGHYIDEHGLSKAVKDADERIAEAYAERDCLRAEVERLLSWALLGAR
jgi:chromosome segregation ATPase